MKIRTRSLLLSTALSLPIGGMAGAQSLVDINEEELSGKSQECQSLAQAYRDDDDPTGVPEDDVVSAINEDAIEECSTLEQQLSASSSQSSSESDSEAVSEEVDLSEEATIEGEAEVSVPDPNVDVQVPPPNVTVTEQQPQVTVTEKPVDVQVNQKQPDVTVEIPEIVVRVQNPAPDIYILSTDPDVQISSADPDVQIEQGEPTVNVTQADPELNVDLGVDMDESSGGGDQSNTSSSSGGNAQNVTGDTEVASSEPEVEIVQPEGEADVSVEGSDPNVSYQSAEPNVSVMMAEQPTVEVSQSGEPNVVIETPQEREQRLAQQDSEQGSTEQSSQSDQAAAPSEDAPSAGGSTMTVGDLMDMQIVTEDGEGLGNPEAIVEIDGEPNLVLSSGGFLGLGGKQVPVPLSRATQQGEELVIDGLTDADIEAANDFEYDSNLEMGEDQQVQIGGN